VEFFIRDLNGHVGTTRRVLEIVHEGFRYGDHNQKGKKILYFTIAYDLMVSNIFFRKRVPLSYFQ
jgi:hypothetical protein